MECLRILIAQADSGLRRVLVAVLEELQHEVVGEVEDLEGLERESLAVKPDLIVAGFTFPAGDSVGTLERISEVRPTPCIIIAQKKNLEAVEKAMKDHVMAFLITPVTQDDLEPTILVVMRRFQEMEELKKENSDLKEALAMRKRLERAKGILMAQQKLTEEEAYLRLRKLATSRRMKLGEVSEIVIEMSQKQIT